MTVIAGPELERRFREITDGWMLVDDFDDLCDRIEKLAELTKDAGGLEWLEEGQRATIRFMIECQVMRGIARGDCGPELQAMFPGPQPEETD